MLFIITEKDTEEIRSIHYCPFDEKNGMHMTEEELKAIGYLVDSTVPDPDVIAGKSYKLMYSLEKGIYYSYYDIPKTEAEIQAEKMLALQTDFVTQKEINDRLILDNLNMQGQIDSLISSVLTV